MKRLALALAFGIALLVTTGTAVEKTGELSKKELKELLSKAATPGDHNRLVRHFEAKAQKYQADAAEHAELAQMYRAKPTVSEMKRPMSPDTAAHCDFIAENLGKAAKEARALADAHKQMAHK